MDPIALVARHGLALVFANVLLEQAGVPIPAVPTLIVSGALAAEGKMSGFAVFAVTLAACALADGAWYLAGRRRGLGILKLLCKLSLSPDSCVRQTELKFERWGSWSLVFGKFIPGVSTVAPPLAGAMGVGWPRFLFFNTIGTALWASVPIAAGMAFHGEIAAVIERIETMGTFAVQIVAVLLAAWIAIKWTQRHLFLRALRLQRITVEELRRLMESGGNPIVVDVRAPSAREADGRYIPGALAIDLADVVNRRADLPQRNEIVFYCTCPNEASAAMAAKQLMQLGYSRVRPLLGGLDEWIAAGYEVEQRG
jgi:membrane protein DedA with SNARE-associated domain/rhodanese-related sulfurtransferase